MQPNSIRELSPVELEAISGGAVRCSYRLVCNGDSCYLEHLCYPEF